jgi:hypothetical protein
MITKKLHDIQNNLFNLFIIFTYSMYALLLLGLSTNAPKYLAYVDSIVQVYISFFLILRFNPFRKIVFSDLDRKICFSAGLFLFATTTINHILIAYIDKIKNSLTKFIKS